MSVLPDQAGWQRIGESHALLLENGLVAINDNSRGERIAFETWSDEISRADEVRVRASLRVLSNLEGSAVTMEIARPGLELVLRLYPNQVVLVEREGDGFRWLAGYAVDLSDFAEVELIKRGAAEGEIEEVEVRIAGTTVLAATPGAVGTLGVSRVIIGSLSYADEGASIWDWIELERRATGGSVKVESRSLASIKARFGAP